MINLHNVILSDPGGDQTPDLLVISWMQIWLSHRGRLGWPEVNKWIVVFFLELFVSFLLQNKAIKNHHITHNSHIAHDIFIQQDSDQPILIDCVRVKDTSTLVGYFVSSPRERKKRDRRDSRGDEREGQGRKRKINKSEETEEIKIFPFYPYLLQKQQALPNCKPITVGRSSDARYTTPLPHPTTPRSAYVFAQSDQRLYCLYVKTWDPWVSRVPNSNQIVQDDPSLGWVHVIR